MKIKLFTICLVAGVVGCLYGCRTTISDIPLAGDISVFPDYNGITIPQNIAPLNFTINVKADAYLVGFNSANEKYQFTLKSGNSTIEIPLRKWRKLLEKKGDIHIIIACKLGRQWKKYTPLNLTVSSDNIDNFLVYRLIEPGYESWNKMGIYQRNLENFTEKTVIDNELTGGNCMNCHAFANNNSDNMMLHIRGRNGGTLFYNNKKLTKINTKIEGTLSAGVYPAWHPNGQLVMFSVNHIVQSFHAIPKRKIEVIDTLSDLVLYQVSNNTVLTIPQLSTPDFETFPTWEPRGQYLYYCSAKFHSYHDFMQTRYDLLRIKFDSATLSFGQPETVIHASNDSMSISFPRFSPDGRYLLYCLSHYGNFTIWHDDSDLMLYDMEQDTVIETPLNSEFSESYHSWSSNGRWVVFSSRRLDGRYTRLYISYFDKDGKFHKPFLLPQKNPGYNMDLLKSFNVPEFITTPVCVNAYEIARTVESEPVAAKKAGR